MLDDRGTYKPNNHSLPKAFEVSVELHKLETAMLETDKLTNIALGDHGFGKKFTEKPAEQFIVCCIAETAQQRETLVKATNAFIADKPWGKRVRVEGLARGQ